MNDIRALLLLELRSFYGINKIRYTKDPAVKKRCCLLSVAWVAIAGMLISYISGLVYGLCSLGLSTIVPAYLVMLPSVTIVAFGMFSAGNRIFGQEGYDILASMPVRPQAIVISRFLGLYIADFVLTVALMLPGIVTYGVCAQPPVWFYVTAVVAMLCVPAIPLVLSTLCGMVILAVSSRMKNKSLVQTALSVLIALSIMMVSFSMDSLTANLSAEQLADLAQTIGLAIGRVYPPTMWINATLIDGRMTGLLLFVLLSVAVAAVAMWLMARNFHAIVHRLLHVTAKHTYTIGRMQRHGLLKTLYFREAKRYFSSGIYVTNTIFGPLLGMVLAVAICVAGVESITSLLPAAVDVVAALPFVFSAVFCMMTTSSVSISMEGKTMWIVQSLPVAAKTWLDSKILFNLSLMLPFYTVAQVMLAVALRPTMLQLLWMLLIPALMMVLSVVLGITVNLKFHSFDWDREEVVVKQSLPAALGGFSGVVISGALCLVMLAAPAEYRDTVKLVMCVGLGLGIRWLYARNNRCRLAEL